MSALAPSPASRVPAASFDSSSNVLSPPLPLPPDSVYTSCYCEENIYLLAKTFLAEANARAAGGVPWPWEIYVVFISNRGKTVALWSQKLRAPDIVLWDYHVILVLRHAASHRPHAGDVLNDREVSIPASTPHGTPCVQGAAVNVNHARGDGDLKLNVSQTSVGAGTAWAYDFDTTLPAPSSWRGYIASTFPYAFDDELKARIDDRFLSLFRVIPADVYLDYFASDRSHMIIPTLSVGLATNIEVQPISSLGTDGEGGVNETVDQEASTGPRYSSPPPSYPPICGAKAKELGIVHNLMESFVAMDVRAAAAEEDLQEEQATSVRALNDAGVVSGARSAPVAVQYGQVMDVAGFVRWLLEADDAPAPRWASQN